MSLFRYQGSKVWTMDFLFHGQRIRESTGTRSKTLAQKIQNNAWAVVADIDLMRPANNKANGSGARMTTHFKGVEKIGT